MGNEKVSDVKYITSNKYILREIAGEKRPGFGRGRSRGFLRDREAESFGGVYLEDAPGRSDRTGAGACCHRMLLRSPVKKRRKMWISVWIS